MKLHCIVLMGMLCIQIKALSQAPNKTKEPKPLSKHWSFQATAGMQANYFTDEQPHSAVAVGFNGQFRINYAFKKKWGVFAEGGYAGNGGVLVSFTDATNLGFDPTIQFKNTKQSAFLIHSLESSLGLSYRETLKAGWKIRLYAAPQLAINLGEWEHYEKTGYMITPLPGQTPVIGTIEGRQYTDYFDPYWFNIMGGVQLELPVKRNAFLIDFRFVNGITPVRWDYSYIHSPGIQGNIRNNSFRLGVGYLLYGHASAKKTNKK